MARLECEQWALEFPPAGHSTDVTAADLNMPALSSGDADRPLLTLATARSGLAVLIPRAVSVKVNGASRPLITMVLHGDEVMVGQYECRFDALRPDATRECGICRTSPGEEGNRVCPLCGTAYCATCEADAAGRRCVGQSCRFRFPREVTA